MRASRGRRVRRLLFLCALVLGVVGMHHVALGTSHDVPCHEVHAAATPAGSHAGSGGHDMLHPCLAVLHPAGGVLLLAWLLLTVGSAFPAPSADLRPPVPRVWRLRRPAGRSLLTSVCVSRI
jgi:hypothetical protein